MDITLQEVADIVDDTRGKNYFSNQLEKALAPLFKKLKSIEKSKETLKTADLFKLDEQRATRLADRYEKVLNDLISAKEEQVEELKKTNLRDITSGKKPTGGSYNVPRLPSLPLSNRPPIPKKGKFDLEESEDKVIPVHIESVSDSVVKKLNSATTSRNEDIVSTTKNNSETKGESGGGGKDRFGKKGGILGKIFSYIATGGLSLLALTAGAVLLYKGFKSDGPFKGTMKIIGKKLVEVGIGMVEDVFKWIGTAFDELTDPKTIKRVYKKMRKLNIGKSLTKKLVKIMATAGTGAKIVFKKIWGLGAIISFAFAYSRFKKGDIIGGILEITSGLLSLVPVVGTALAFIPDIFLAFRDFTTTSAERKKQSGDMFAPLIKWVQNLKFVKSLTNTFKGLGLLFGGSSPDDIDKGIELLSGENGLLGVMFPWFDNILYVLDFFRSGGFMNVVNSVGTGIKNFGQMIAESVSSIFKKAWGYITDLVTNIGKSDFMQSAISMVHINFLKAMKGIHEVFGGFIDIILKVPKKLNEGIKWVANKLGLDYQTPRWFDDAVGNPPTSADIADVIDSQIAAAENQRDLREQERMERRTKMVEDNADRRHNELMAVVADSAQRTVEASVSTTKAVISSGRDNTEASNNITNVFNNNNNNSNRLRDMVFVDVYGT